jgi:anti-sigma B factor antagonist
VSIRGDLDIATADRVRAAVAEALAIAPGGLLTLDLGGVEFIDASGIHELLDAREACAAAGGSLRILAPESVARVLALAGVSERLPLE